MALGGTYHANVPRTLTLTGWVPNASVESVRLDPTAPISGLELVALDPSPPIARPDDVHPPRHPVSRSVPSARADMGR